MYFDAMSFLVAFHNYSNRNSFVKNPAISANTCARKVLVALKVEIKNGANYEASDALKHTPLDLSSLVRIFHIRINSL